MRLHVFVNRSQMLDRGLLTAGDLIDADLRSFPVGYLTFNVPPGTKALRRTGVFEYLFAGEVKQVRSEPNSAQAGQVWQQVFVDCGLPLEILHDGQRPLSLWARLDEPREITSSSVGAFIGGAIFLEADISYVSPRRLAPGVGARVDGIKVLRIAQEAIIEQESVEKLDFQSPNGEFALGAILEIETGSEMVKSKRGQTSP